MSEEKFLVNDGNGVKEIPVESKEPILVKEIRETIEKQAGVPESLIKGLEEAKNGELLNSPEDFSKHVEKKKRGRPSKKTIEEKPVKEFYCATCREKYLETTVMKVGAGTNRWAIFCPVDQKSLGFLQPDLDEKVANLIKNNPTK